MECSPEDALSLLNSWHDQSTVLHLWLAPPDGWAYRVVTFGRVEAFTPQVIRLTLVSGGLMTVDLTQTKFDYSDAREALPALREAVDREIVCTLRMTTPECRFALGEPREQ
jgi:hypothetical protein